jgi:hypothetical protein
MLIVHEKKKEGPNDPQPSPSQLRISWILQFLIIGRLAGKIYP